VLALGFRTTICCVDTAQLPIGFAGREYDRTLLAELPPGVDPCAERGEFHTCVHAGPVFRRPLMLERGEVVLRDGRFGFCDLLLGKGPAVGGGE
jgi:diphthamide synthase (EF-2-diphthine--ammonia ligase)